MTIRDLLATKKKMIITIDGYASVSQAVAEMVGSNVGSIIVLLEGTVYGIFTERDALVTWTSCGEIKGTPVMKFATTKLIITNEDDTLENALCLMSQNNIRHLLIMDDKKLLGVLSMRDVIKAYASNLVTNVQYMEKLLIS